MTINSRLSKVDWMNDEQIVIQDHLQRPNSEVLHKESEKLCG